MSLLSPDQTVAVRRELERLYRGQTAGGYQQEHRVWIALKRACPNEYRNWTIITTRESEIFDRVLMAELIRLDEQVKLEVERIFNQTRATLNRATTKRAFITPRMARGLALIGVGCLVAYIAGRA